MTNIMILMKNMMNNPKEAMIILGLLLSYLLAFSGISMLLARTYLKRKMKAAIAEADSKPHPDEGTFWDRDEKKAGVDPNIYKPINIDWKNDLLFLYNLIEDETRRRFFFEVDVREMQLSGQPFNITSDVLDEIHDYVIKKVYYSLPPTYLLVTKKYFTDFALKNHISAKISDLLEELRIIKDNDFLTKKDTTSPPEHMEMAKTLELYTSKKYRKVSMVGAHQLTQAHLKANINGEGNRGPELDGFR